VADYNTKKLLPAEKAVWVIGGGKTGVMTKRAKWAFSDKQGADAFIQKNGGLIAILTRPCRPLSSTCMKTSK